MKICYENSMEDVYAFQEHYLVSSQTIRNKLIMNRICGALFIPLFTSLFAWFFVREAFLFFVISGTVVGLTAYLFYPKYWRARARKYLDKLYREGRASNVLGNHELEITDEGLFARSPLGEGKNYWDKLGPVVETDTHLFIHVTPLAAHIIPKKKISPDTFAEFRKLIADRIPASVR